MRVLLSLIILACTAQAQTYVISAGCTALPCTVTSTGAAHLVVVVMDESTAPTGIKIGAQAMTQVGATFNGSISTLTAWVVSNSTGSQTSVACNGTCGGSVFAVHEYEFSGMITTSAAAVFDWLAFSNTASGSQITTFFTPSTANEAIVTAVNCSGSATSLSGSAWAHTQFPNGEGAGEIITSSIALTSSEADSGCTGGSGNGGIIVGFRAAGATGTTCSSTFADQVGELEVTGITATATPKIHLAGDLFVMTVLCVNGCTPSAPTLGAQTATQIGVAGNSSASTGQPFVYYILSTAATGAQTLSFTGTGATTVQIYAKEFTPNPGCTYSHDTDATLGSQTGVTTITQPSITAAAGDLLFVFSAVSNHVSTVNSPWSCQPFIEGTYGTGNCNYINTVNADGYILSGSGSSTANNMTPQTTPMDYQALITSFKASLPITFVAQPWVIQVN